MYKVPEDILKEANYLVDNLSCLLQLHEDKEDIEILTRSRKFIKLIEDNYLNPKV